MKNKLAQLIKNKPLIAAVLAAAVILSALGAAALSGAFGSMAEKDAGVSFTGSASGQDSTLSFAGGEVKITALDSDSLGVNPTSEFKLAFSQAPDVKTLEASLSVEPSQAYQLNKISDNEYNMKFEEPMEKNSIYRFVLSDQNTGEKQSWAFQTKKSLSVLRTLPRDKAVQVPVNSGIEITFSYENVVNPEKYFEITPKTGGRFEMHKSTLVFVPEKLEEGTVYTVKIKSGLGVKGSGDTLPADYTFSFQTKVKDSASGVEKYFGFFDRLYNFTPQASPALQVYADDSMLNKEIAVELYSYPNAQDFLAALKKHQPKYPWAVNEDDNTGYDESALEKAASVKAKIVEYQNTYWSTNYLLLPSSLPEGYYLVKAEANGRQYYAQVQINKASVYIMATKDKCLAWLNDSITGKPLSGAEFRYDGGGSVKTGDDGMAVLNVDLDSSSEPTNYYFLIKPHNGPEFAAQVSGGNYTPYYGYNSNSETINNYWTYIYLDKGVYLPEDTVNLWGVLKPRNGDKGIAGISLELIRYDYSDNSDGSASVLTSCKAEMSADGTFTGSLRLSNYNPGSYEVRVRAGDEILLTTYLRIMDYTKPVYRIEAVPDRNYLSMGEEVSFDVQASFFEGTPVSGIKLSYDATIDGRDLARGSLVSDGAGSSRLTVKPDISVDEWRPLYLYAHFGNNEAEEQQINEYSYVTVFPKDTMIEAKSAGTDGNTGRLSVFTSRIDLKKLEGKAPGYYSEDDYRGNPVDMPLTVKLYEKYYVKKKTGEYYDYINKVKRDKYEYNEVNKLVKEYSVKTVSGKCELTCPIEDEKNYYAEIYGHDSKGRSIKETSYLYDWNYYSPYNTSTYSITEDGNYKQYKQGEKVSVEVKYNKDTPYEGGSRRYLFVRLKNGVVDFSVKDSSAYDFTFDESFIPNIYVKALCFDGKNTYDAGIRQYTYDRQEKKLEITAIPDKKGYKPGDTVRLAFDVKDADGNPYSSEINISIVDEAFFAVVQQDVDTLSGLYSPAVSNGIIADFLSYSALDESATPMAEGGEGGDMYVRKDFKDSAFFASVKSGSDGKAEASFKLPDNLTSWRVTYQAVTGGLKAGNGKINIVTKLPFFVDTIFNDAFIAGDSPSILLRAYGTELSSAAEVDYKVVLSNTEGIVKTLDAKGKANTITDVPLGSLAEGNYTVRAEAVSGKLKDALERSFRVSGSLLETAVTKYITLKDDTALPGDTKGLTSVVFYGEDSSMLYNELHSLYWNWGERIDQKLARKVAGGLLKKYFQEDVYDNEEYDIKKYQTEDGGLALLSYDSSNPALSAKMCALAADSIDRKSLVSYFYKLLQDDKTIDEDRAYALWGLAALKEPVLLDINSALEAAEATPKIRLILGTALAEIGDFQRAGDIYQEALKSSGKITDSMAYVENGTRDETIDATALCSLIALKINAPEKLKLFNYIKSNSTSELMVNLERMIFVTNYIKSAGLESSFSYELDGVRKKVDLSGGSSYGLTLTPEKLAAIRFSDVSGKVAAAVSYTAPVSEVRKSEGGQVSISRVYSAEGKSAGSFERSDTVKITITPSFSETAPDGYYEITDILPAGFRFLRSGDGDGSGYIYPDEITGQKVVFGYNYSKRKPGGKSIVYYARAVTPGEFTADNAAIRHIESNITGFADKVRVNVK